jgi:hypothetical protein
MFAATVSRRLEESLLLMASAICPLVVINTRNYVNYSHRCCKKAMCSDIHIMEQKNIMGSYDFLAGSRASNAKFTLIFVFVLSISATFPANSGNLRRIILAHVLSSSSVVNANVITNPSLISKASLASRMAL